MPPVIITLFSCFPLIFEGHVPALYNMGSHYFAGKGIELDMKKAGEFFKRAADLGFGLAQVCFIVILMQTFLP